MHQDPSRHTFQKRFRCFSFELDVTRPSSRKHDFSLTIFTIHHPVTNTRLIKAVGFASIPKDTHAHIGYERVTMGIWDVFTGSKSQPASDIASSQDLRDTATPGVSFNTVTPDDVGSFITTPGAFDPAALHPLAGLNQDTLDYLTLDDSALTDLPGGSSFLPSRGWSDDLCYGTGVSYLAALSMGGAWGLAEGLNRLPPTAPPKLRLNSVLNAVTRRGPFMGNSAGVIALMYNGVNSFIGYTRGKHDAFNSVAAGTISGLVFKSSRGLKPMLISGTIVGSVAGGWALTRKVFFDKE